MTDHKKEKSKKPAGWLDDMETFEKLSLETAFSDPNAGTYWAHREEDLGELQPFTTSYVRCDFKVVAEDEIKKGQDDIQKLTDRYIKEADTMLASKEKEIMEV